MSRSLKLINLYSKKNYNIFFVSLMIFFFVIFDGMLMYAAPIIMSHNGLGEGQVGLIIGLSSVAGMFFDLLLAKLIRNATYRSIFFVMLLVATTYPVFLFGATSVTVYLIAMAVWGLYYNLYNVGMLDFVSRSGDRSRHAHTFGVLKVFDGLGYMLAPLVGSWFILSFTNDTYTAMLSVSILLPAYFFYILLILYKNKHSFAIGNTEKISEKVELQIWKRVMKALLPILILTWIINLMDSGIWTIGPLFSESLSGDGFIRGSYFMLAYTIPPLLTGWLVGRGVELYGRKYMSVGNLIAGSIFVGLISFIHNPYFLLLDIFLASLFFSLSWPTINSLYADYIIKNEDAHEESESVEDLFTNLGDVSGPIIAGYLAQYFGNQNTFMYLGFSFAVTVSILYLLRFFKI